VVDGPAGQRDGEAPNVSEGLTMTRERKDEPPGRPPQPAARPDGPSPEDDATLQMDPEAIKELHRRLEGRSGGATPRSTAGVDGQGETVRMEPEELAALHRELDGASAARAAGSAPTPTASAAPDRPLSLPIGGIGALLTCAYLLLAFVPDIAARFRDPAEGYAILGLGVAGFAVMAPALAVAVRRTNTLAGVAALACYLVVIATIFELAAASALDPGIVRVVGLSRLALVAVAFALIGAWSLRAAATLGGLGVACGVACLAGGLAWGGYLVAGLAGAGSEPSEALVEGASLVTQLATIGAATMAAGAALLGVTLLTRLR